MKKYLFLFVLSVFLITADLGAVRYGQLQDLGDDQFQLIRETHQGTRRASERVFLRHPDGIWVDNTDTEETGIDNRLQRELEAEFRRQHELLAQVQPQVQPMQQVQQQMQQIQQPQPQVQQPEPGFIRRGFNLGKNFLSRGTRLGSDFALKSQKILGYAELAGISGLSLMALNNDSIKTESPNQNRVYWLNRTFFPLCIGTSLATVTQIANLFRTFAARQGFSIDNINRNALFSLVFAFISGVLLQKTQDFSQICGLTCPSTITSGSIGTTILAGLVLKVILNR